MVNYIKVSNLLDGGPIIIQVEDRKKYEKIFKLMGLELSFYETMKGYYRVIVKD